MAEPDCCCICGEDDADVGRCIDSVRQRVVLYGICRVCLEIPDWEQLVLAAVRGVALMDEPVCTETVQ